MLELGKVVRHVLSLRSRHWWWVVECASCCKAWSRTHLMAPLDHSVEILNKCSFSLHEGGDAVSSQALLPLERLQTLLVFRASSCFFLVVFLDLFWHPSYFGLADHCNLNVLNISVPFLFSCHLFSLSWQCLLLPNSLSCLCALSAPAVSSALLVQSPQISSGQTENGYTYGQ